MVEGECDSLYHATLRGKAASVGCSCVVDSTLLMAGMADGDERA